MNDFNTGAQRPVNDTARAKRLSAAEALVRKTLSQHGLATLPHVTTQSVGQSLGDLMQSLLPNGIVHLQGGASDVLDVPDEAQFLSAVHQARSGSRAYRTYVPASAKEEASGIVMMLHGCTQTPEDFAIGTGMNALADHHGFIVIYPEQSRGSNAQTCWNWFSPGDQRRDRGEPEILAGIAREAMSQYGVASDRTFVAGLSAGAGMAVILGHTYPDVFAAMGAHSGLPYGAARDVASAFAAMSGQPTHAAGEPPHPRIRTIVFHGSADTTVHPSNGEAIARTAERHGPAESLQTTHRGATSGRSHTTTISTDAEGRSHLEHWVIDGLGHAWSGGQSGGSYTDPHGPDASAEMIRFFFEPKE